jgi:hypothetical protein
MTLSAARAPQNSETPKHQNTIARTSAHLNHNHRSSEPEPFHFTRKILGKSSIYSNMVLAINPDCNEGSIHEEAQLSSEAPQLLSPCASAEKCVQACSAYGRICPHAARAAGRAACAKLDKLLLDSRFFTAKPNLPKIDLKDIEIGERLGEGGFCFVNKCTLKSSKHTNKSDEYAIKYLKLKGMVDFNVFQHGASDLATEAFFLGSISHPNIVTLHGVTAGDVECNVASAKECGFFIVIDRMVETVDHRIARWHREAAEEPSGIFVRMSNAYKEKQKAKMLERLQVALDIASAMEYLHSLSILFRDLKPDNIGFDKEDTLKLFDFGLAREEKSKDANANGKYNMTGHTGSRRYMAPEGKNPAVCCWV